MTVLSRQLVREEVATGLAAELAGAGKLCAAVYPYQPDTLDGASPVVLVLSKGTRRRPRGMGAQSYNNTFTLELHILVFDGEEAQPLTAQEREDKVDAIEAAIAAWCAQHQKGTTYRALEYTPDPTSVTKIPYLDGNPYILEIAHVELEAPDQ